MLQPRRSSEDSVSLEDLLPTLLEEGLNIELEVTGASMAPFIRDHDVVVLGPFEPQTLGLGDVVVFQRADQRWILHRVVRLASDRVLIRGDAAVEDDGWILRRDLKARLQRIERYGRRVHLGLGYERAIIAWLSEQGLLAPGLRPLRWLLRRLG